MSSTSLMFGTIMDAILSRPYRQIKAGEKLCAEGFHIYDETESDLFFEKMNYSNMRQIFAEKCVRLDRKGRQWPVSTLAQNKIHCGEPLAKILTEKFP